MKSALVATVPAGQTIAHASSKSSRGDRGWSFDGSPYPRLHRKFDLIVVPTKKARRSWLSMGAAAVGLAALALAAVVTP